MSQFLPEMTMGRAFTSKGMTRLALRAHRYYDLSKEAAARGALTRATMLRLMSDAYNSAGLGWFHRQQPGVVAFDSSAMLFGQADEFLDRARCLSVTEDQTTVSASGMA